MQLIVLLAMLMFAGNKNYAQIKPIIEEFGGEEARCALQQAEELSQMISTVQAITSPPPKAEPCPDHNDHFDRPDCPDDNAVSEQPRVESCHPLDPIKPIADERTLAALSQYIALGE